MKKNIRKSETSLEKIKAENLEKVSGGEQPISYTTIDPINGGKTTSLTFSEKF